MLYMNVCTFRHPSNNTLNQQVLLTHS
jgi:hypothetical protein